MAGFLQVTAAAALECHFDQLAQHLQPALTVTTLACSMQRLALGAVDGPLQPCLLLPLVL